MESPCIMCDSRNQSLHARMSQALESLNAILLDSTATVCQPLLTDAGQKVITDY